MNKTHYSNKVSNRHIEVRYRDFVHRVQHKRHSTVRDISRYLKSLEWVDQYMPVLVYAKWNGYLAEDPDTLSVPSSSVVEFIDFPWDTHGAVADVIPIISNATNRWVRVGPGCTIIVDLEDSYVYKDVDFQATRRNLLNAVVLRKKPEVVVGHHLLI